MNNYFIEKIYIIQKVPFVMKSYDLIIIGAGPAGLTAGIYATRGGLKTAIVSKDIGGTANSIAKLENWPGFSGTGAELMKKFYEHVKDYKIDTILSEVEKIEKSKDKFLVYTKKEKSESRAVIIATGRGRKKLNILGEQKFFGKGVSYCVTCDGIFFKGKTTVVIGGSDCASISALALSEIAKKVYLVYRGEKLKCEKIILEKLKKKKNVEIIYNAVPLQIQGKEKAEYLVIEQNRKKMGIKIDGIFVEVGSVPLVEFAKKLNLKLDKEDDIITDEEMKTSVSGIFAAGDITNSRLKQVLTASSQGAIAAKSAVEYLTQ